MSPSIIAAGQAPADVLAQSAHNMSAVDWQKAIIARLWAALAASRQPQPPGFKPFSGGPDAPPEKLITVRSSDPEAPQGPEALPDLVSRLEIRTGTLANTFAYRNLTDDQVGLLLSEEALNAFEDLGLSDPNNDPAISQSLVAKYVAVYRKAVTPA